MTEPGPAGSMFFLWRRGANTSRRRVLQMSPAAERGQRNSEERAMLRKLFLSAALGLGALSGLNTTAQAAPVGEHGYAGWHHHHRFEVFYRRDCHCAWRCAGGYRCFEEAEREACHLRHCGFEAFIR
jgi:hypothetical protein